MSVASCSPLTTRLGTFRLANDAKRAKSGRDTGPNRLDGPRPLESFTRPCHHYARHLDTRARDARHHHNCVHDHEFADDNRHARNFADARNLANACHPRHLAARHFSAHNREHSSPHNRKHIDGLNGEHSGCNQRRLQLDDVGRVVDVHRHVRNVRQSAAFSYMPNQLHVHGVSEASARLG